MNFKLSYSGSPGSVTATLKDDADKVLAEIDGLKDEKAAAKWASDVARSIKAEAAIVESKAHNVYVTIRGHKHFAL